MIIVSDSSPLICFAILGMLDILNDIIEEIMVPTAVYKEISVPKKPYLEEIKPLLDRLIENRIRIGASLYQKALELARES